MLLFKLKQKHQGEKTKIAMRRFLRKNEMLIARYTMQEMNLVSRVPLEYDGLKAAPTTPMKR